MFRSSLRQSPSVEVSLTDGDDSASPPDVGRPIEVGTAATLLAMPFFNPYRKSYVEDPYPSLATLRAEAPVFRSAELDAWIVTSYAACAQILGDPDTFVSNPADPAAVGGSQLAEQLDSQRTGSRFGERVPMVRSDEPAHRRSRLAVQRAFTPGAVAALRESTAANAARLLDVAEAGQPFEAMAGLANPLPVDFVIALLGIPEDRVRRYRDAALAVQAARAHSHRDPMLARQAQRAEGVIFEELKQLVADERGTTGSLLDVLVQPSTGVEPTASGELAPALAPDERVKMAYDIAVSGNNSTAFFLGNMLHALAAHPEQYAKLRARRDLMPNAVDEALRYDGPTQEVMRFVTADTDLAGQHIRRGQAILVMVGAAGRDPAEFADPDRLDVERRAPTHLNFGRGIHFCLGMPSVRILGETMIEELLARFDTLEVPRRGVEWGGTLPLRGPRYLKLVGKLVSASE